MMRDIRSELLVQMDKAKTASKKLINIHVLFILVTMAEIVGTVLLSSVLGWLMQELFNRVVEIPIIVWLLFFSLTIGLAASVVVNLILLQPIVRLNKAMKRVASGDFTVRLETKNIIREINDTYESFNLMTEELHATETLQTDFVSNVSHEFKTPINAIEGYATLLQGSSEEQKQEYVERIEALAAQNNTSFNNVVVSMIEYCLNEKEG